jgi:hypothetical protein
VSKPARSTSAREIDRHDDAVWLTTVALWGNDEDRVVVKSRSETTTKEDES